MSPIYIVVTRRDDEQPDPLLIHEEHVARSEYIGKMQGVGLSAEDLPDGTTVLWDAGEPVVWISPSTAGHSGYVPEKHLLVNTQGDLDETDGYFALPPELIAFLDTYTAL